MTKQATGGKPTTIMFPSTTVTPVTLNVSPNVTNSAVASINLISTTTSSHGLTKSAETVSCSMNQTPGPAVITPAPIVVEPKVEIKPTKPEIVIKSDEQSIAPISTEPIPVEKSIEPEVRAEDLLTSFADLPSDMLDVPDSILEEPSYTIEVPSNADETINEVVIPSSSNCVGTICDVNDPTSSSGSIGLLNNSSGITGQTTSSTNTTSAVITPAVMQEQTKR